MHLRYLQRVFVLVSLLFGIASLFVATERGFFAKWIACRMQFDRRTETEVDARTCIYTTHKLLILYFSSSDLVWECEMVPTER